MARIDVTAKRFLVLLQDGKWHRKILSKDGKRISIKAVEACVELGWVERRLTRIRGEEPARFIGSFKITAKGKRALTKDSFNWYEIDQAAYRALGR